MLTLELRNSFGAEHLITFSYQLCFDRSNVSCNETTFRGDSEAH